MSYIHTYIHTSYILQDLEWTQKNIIVMNVDWKIIMQMWGIEMTDKPKDIEKYFENSRCKICGVIVQPHFQGNTKLPKEEHLAKEHSDLEWKMNNLIISR